MNKKQKFEPAASTRVDRFFLPTEKKDPNELFIFFSYLILFGKNYHRTKIKEERKFTQNFALAKDIKDIDFYRARQGTEQKIVSIFPYTAIEKLYKSIPDDKNKVQSVYSLFFKWNIFPKTQMDELYCLTFYHKKNGWYNVWARALDDGFIPYLYKIAFKHYGKLIGVVPEYRVKSCIEEADIILSDKRGQKIKHFIHDFRELDLQKDRYHLLSREYYNLTPEEAAREVVNEGMHIANYGKNEKDMQIEFEESIEDTYQRLIKGITWARKEELKNSKNQNK